MLSNKHLKKNTYVWLSKLKNVLSSWKGAHWIRFLLDRIEVLFRNQFEDFGKKIRYILLWASLLKIRIKITSDKGKMNDALLFVSSLVQVKPWLELWVLLRYVFFPGQLSFFADVQAQCPWCLDIFSSFILWCRVFVELVMMKQFSFQITPILLPDSDITYK